MSVISVYAPTLTSTDDVIMSFYQGLRSLLTSIPKEKYLMLLGDFNTRVGSDHNTWNLFGPYGIGKMNSNGHYVTPALFRV